MPDCLRSSCACWRTSRFFVVVGEYPIAEDAQLATALGMLLAWAPAAKQVRPGIALWCGMLHFILMRQTDPELTDAVLGLLVEVEARAGANFSGTGIIVSASPDDLPILALRSISDPGKVSDVAEMLATISNPANEHHDGFHVLSPELRILRLGQYFSPPIIHDAFIDRTRRFGGRYLAALFGSAIPGILATGIASCDFGIAVFCSGREIAYRSGRSSGAARVHVRAS